MSRDKFHFLWIFIHIFIAMACAYVSGLDPAYDGTGLTLNRSSSWNFVAHQGPRFTNPEACTTVSATLVNDRLFLYQTNSTNRAIPDAESASGTFFNINYHGISTFWGDGVLECWSNGKEKLDEWPSSSLVEWLSNTITWYFNPTSLRAVGSMSRKQACKPYELEVEPEA